MGAENLALSKTGNLSVLVPIGTKAIAALTKETLTNRKKSPEFENLTYHRRNVLTTQSPVTYTF